ncbi:MAG: PorP/SprF family type IX secretion system membrane protein [Saprospiraceae bacterium]|nr:PorP/SprF family type IX secretion system membrane protein [Saprospiraceae bacterium]
MKLRDLLFRLCSVLVLMFPLLIANAQDIHFSQFGNTPLNLSPGLAGVFGGDIRFVANYRDQWRAVPVPYTTFSGSVENKVYWATGKYDRFLTGSILINYDQQGSLKLTSLQIGIPISVTLPVNKATFVTLGVTPAFGQRSFGTSKLTVDAQWQQSVFDPLAPTRETELFHSQNLKYFDLSAGINIRRQSAKKRSKVDVGTGLHHLNRPYHDFWSVTLSNPGNVRLFDKLSIYGLGLLQLTDNFDIVGQFLYQKQGEYQERVYGGGVRLHLNRKPYKELALQVGVDFRQRFGKSLTPHVELFYKTWQLGFTYDTNVWNDLDLITNGRGGPEVSLSYRYHKVKPVPAFKSCQLF